MSKAAETHTTNASDSTSVLGESALTVPLSAVAACFNEWSAALDTARERGISDELCDARVDAADKVLRRLARTCSLGAADVRLKLQAFEQETIPGRSRLASILMRSVMADLARLAATA